MNCGELVNLRFARRINQKFHRINLKAAMFVSNLLHIHAIVFFFFSFMFFIIFRTIKSNSKKIPISFSCFVISVCCVANSLFHKTPQKNLNSFKERRSSQNENEHMKRSQSMSQQMADKAGDIMGLNHVFQQHQQSPIASNASTPTTAHPYAPLQSPTLSLTNNST